MNVRFQFGDHILEGEVVDQQLLASYNSVPEKQLTVDVDGQRYRCLERDIEPA